MRASLRQPEVHRRLAARALRAGALRRRVAAITAATLLGSWALVAVAGPMGKTSSALAASIHRGGTSGRSAGDQGPGGYGPPAPVTSTLS